MTKKKLPPGATRACEPKQIVRSYAKHGSLNKAHRADFKGVGWHRFLRVYRLAVAEGLMPAVGVGAKTKAELKNPKATLEAPTGNVHALETLQSKLPAKGKVKRYLFTSAQNNTYAFTPFLQNLLVLADHYGAEMHVSRFVYLTTSIASVLDKHAAFDSLKKKEKDDIWWDTALEAYYSDKRVEIAPGLVWCGEMNILPTAERPLSGLEVYTGRKSGIFPHVKVAMESIPSGKHQPTKFNYTTGAITLRNYIQRKAGLKAEFHHTYGALLVEVDSDGDWFCRQIIADSDGVIHDLGVRVADGELTEGNRVEAITWGDIHVAEAEQWVLDLSFGKDGMLDYLQPRHQFFHDVLAFRAKSHHEIKKPHMLFRRHLNGETDVRKECTDTCSFMRLAAREWCQNVVVDSNHHDHLGKWCEEQDARYDAKNVEFWIRMQDRIYSDLRMGAETPNYMRLMVEEVDRGLVKQYQFLERDASYVICEDRNGGIECGMHGHSGPDGSRGNPRTLAKLGRKANVGHYHRAGIHDGIYHAGTCGKLAPDWTTGPSSWSHSDIITYPNGKRAIITKWNGKWRAS